MVQTPGAEGMGSKVVKISSPPENSAGVLITRSPLSSSPADYGKAILGENERLAKAVIAANIKPE